MKSFLLKSMMLLIVSSIVSMTAYAATYQFDDGIGEDSIGLTMSGSTFTWMNQFATVGASDYISSIEIAWGDIQADTVATIFIWDDPDNDGSPIDRIGIYSSVITIQNVNTDIFNIFSVPNINVFGSFFVGIEHESIQSTYPARIDQTLSQNRSWIGSAEASLPFDLIDNYGFSGNWMIRANGGGTSPVPEPSTVILLGIGLIGLVGMGRATHRKN